MLRPTSELTGSTIAARDGEIGHVKDFYFDDEAWAIRYLVIDTTQWLPGRDVLISPYSVVQPLGSGSPIDVSLTRQQVSASPPVDTHRPVSRRHERELLLYHDYPTYWEGGALWAMTALPLLPLPLPSRVETEAEAAIRDEVVPEEDVHLCSCHIVTGYDIQAADASIGHVQDFIFDDESWAIRYLVVDTRNWWPGGKKVLLSTRWIDRTDWADRTVFTSLTRKQVREGPAYREGEPLSRADEQALHDAYDRSGYWL